MLKYVYCKQRGCTETLILLLMIQFSCEYQQICSQYIIPVETKEICIHVCYFSLNLFKKPSLQQAVILLLTKYQQVEDSFHLVKFHNCIQMLQGDNASVHLSLGLDRTWKHEWKLQSERSWK